MRRGPRKLLRSLARLRSSEDVSANKISRKHNRHVSFDNAKSHYYYDDNGEEEDALLLRKHSSLDDESFLLDAFQVMHFRKLTEVSFERQNQPPPQKNYDEDESDITGPLLPPAKEVPSVVLCDETDSSTSCDSLLKEDSSDDAITTKSYQERLRQEVSAMDELFHDLTCRCFSPSP